MYTNTIFQKISEIKAALRGQFSIYAHVTGCKPCLLNIKIWNIKEFTIFLKYVGLWGIAPSRSSRCTFARAPYALKKPDCVCVRVSVLSEGWTQLHIEAITRQKSGGNPAQEVFSNKKCNRKITATLRKTKFILTFGVERLHFFNFLLQRNKHQTKQSN